MPRLEEIYANLGGRLQEARDQGWLGEVAAIETTLAAAAQKLEAMRDLTARSASTSIHLGMPDVRPPPDDTVQAREPPRQGEEAERTSIADAR